MKTHTTNYRNTFIEAAEDYPVKKGEIPPEKKAKTLAKLQYEILAANSYKFTSDDILFECFVIKNSIKKNDLKAAREQYFSKGQPCLRASPLPKQYGWGIHFDENGKIAIYGCETNEYKKYCDDESLEKLRALRSGKNK